MPALSALEDLGLVEVAEAIRRGEVASAAVTALALDRLDAIGSRLNAVVKLDRARAMEAAHTADRARAAGRPLGLLHGVPLAHKDLFYRKGRPCAGGSKIRQDFVPDRTATVLERLDAAGALDLGRLHLAEFAMSPTGYNEHFGHARNPWNPAHVPGGSSSGSGVAVSARLVYGSLGSDTGGSIRHPAAMCGVTGLKPTWSRVSRAGAMPLSWSLDCVGPLARSAGDCARLLRAIAGADPADPTAAAVAVPDYEAALTGDIRGLRVARPRGYYDEPLVPAVAQALDESIATLRGLGASIVDTRAPDMALVNALMQVILSVEAATIHRRWLAERPDDYSDQVRSRIEPGLYYPATRYAEALALRAKVTAEWLAGAMGDADVALLPVVPGPVPSIEETTAGSPADVAARIALVTHCNRGINYLGLPAIAIPCGFVAGLPVAFQLVGHPFQEATLLRAADAFQRATAFHRQRPPAC